MEEVQGSATSSLFMPPHFQNMWPCVQLLCAERNAPCQRDLAIDKAEPPASAAKWQGNDQICNVRLQDIATTRSNELLVRLGILILKERRLRWYGHVERSNGAVKTAFDIQVDGKRGPGRSKMTWKQLTERDCREWKLSAINPHDRHTWRSGVRSAMSAASQLSGRGPTDVDVAPVPARSSKIRLWLWYILWMDMAAILTYIPGLTILFWQKTPHEVEIGKGF